MGRTRKQFNNGAGRVFTKYEMEEAGYGTKKRRLGGDSQLPFGHCSLSLQPLEQPVATKSGHLYSKECVLEYLLTKTQELKQQRAAYEAQKAAEVRTAEAAASAAAGKVVERFLDAESVTAGARGGSSGGGGGGGGAASAATAAGDNAAVVASLASKVDTRDKKRKLAELKATSWWVPSFLPTAAAAKIAKPPKRPGSPISGKPLRVKDLVQVRFEFDDDAAAAGGGGGVPKRKIICPIARKEITNQPVVLLCETGTVMLRSSFDRCVAPTMIDPASGRPLGAEGKGWRNLVSGGTGFASHNNVEASTFKATMNA